MIFFMQILYWVSIFLFVFASLYIVKTIYAFCKVLWLKYGKVESGKYDDLFFGLSLSYVITMLIIGF